MFEVREELHAIVAATATAPCVCRAGATCIPCRARTLLAEISTRGIRIRRWRNDPANVPRLVSHIAGGVTVAREPRRSCPRYIVDRSQVCAACSEPLATGKWALFFSPGVSVTKLRLRNGSQDFAQPAQPGDDTISCAQLEKINSVKSSPSCRNYREKCAMLCPMSQNQLGSKPLAHSGEVAYGWTRTGSTIHLVPDELGVRSAILRLHAQGLPFARIAEILNDSGYAGKDGAAWAPKVVQRMAVKPLARELLQVLIEQMPTVTLQTAVVAALDPAPLIIREERLVRYRKKVPLKPLS